MEKDYDKFFYVPIDKYYNYKFGIYPTDQSCLRIERKKDDLQSPVLNFTDDEKYTKNSMEFIPK